MNKREEVQRTKLVVNIEQPKKELPEQVKNRLGRSRKVVTKKDIDEKLAHAETKRSLIRQTSKRRIDGLRLESSGKYAQDN